MSDKSRTIAEAAKIALQNIGQPSSIPVIYAKIIELNLYTFNTPVPEHVLRTEIRRKTDGVERIDSREEVFFRLTGNDVYELMNEPTKRRATIGMKRIQRATDKAKIIEVLTSEQLGVFREIWRVLLFAAALGFKNKRREPIANVDAGRGIDQNSFGNNPAWPGVLYLLSLVETSDAVVLTATENGEDQRISAFEEYANGGLAVLDQKFKTSGCSVDSLLNFIQAELGVGETKKPDLQISI